MTLPRPCPPARPPAAAPSAPAYEQEPLETAIADQFMSGRLLACISSRPGQSGRCDGYILEGPELDVSAPPRPLAPVPAQMPPRPPSTLTIPAAAAAAAAASVVCEVRGASRPQLRLAVALAPSPACRTTGRPPVVQPSLAPRPPHHCHPGAWPTAPVAPRAALQFYRRKLKTKKSK